MSIPDFTDILNNVHGFLSIDEAALLYHLASEVPAGGCIVEIGNFQGRSSVCLALGAKVNGARFYSIDPHEDMQASETTHYGMANHAILLANLVKYNVADVVRLFDLSSMSASSIWREWRRGIDVLWIDGAHDYWSVQFDFQEWSAHVISTGKVALHDSTGHYPDVSRLLGEILTAGQWGISEQVDATSVLVRA